MNAYCALCTKSVRFGAPEAAWWLIGFPRGAAQRNGSTLVVRCPDHVTKADVHRVLGRSKSAMRWYREAKEHADDELPEENVFAPMILQRDIDRLARLPQKEG